MPGISASAQVRQTLRTTADDARVPAAKSYGDPWKGDKDGRHYMRDLFRAAFTRFVILHGAIARRARFAVDCCRARDGCMQSGASPAPA
ncbi:MAG: hypothetical protein QM661_10195 [Solimonas sp.]